MAKKITNVPVSFYSKVNHQTLPGVDTNAKLNATTEWNSSIQDIVDTSDENYERLTLNWDTDVIANQVIALGQYVDFNDVSYRCTTSYDVGAGKTFTGANFQAIGTPGTAFDYKTWYVTSLAADDSGDGSESSPFKTVQAAYDALITDAPSTGIIRIMTGGNYAGITAGISFVNILKCAM